MFSWTRHTSLKLPALGKVTLKVPGSIMGAVVTHVELSKLEPLGETPGHPNWNSGRGCKGVRKVTVWMSSAANVHVMLSPAWIQISLGRKASAWAPLSWLCAPTKACHESACTVCGMIKAASIKSQRKRIGKWIDPKVFTDSSSKQSTSPPWETPERMSDLYCLNPSSEFLPVLR